MKTIEPRTHWLPSEQVLRKYNQILKALALEGPLTIPKLASKTGLPKSTIYEAIYGTSKSSKNNEIGLLGRDRICIIEEKSWRTGLPMRTYGLTCEGLYKFLDNWDDKEVWAKIDTVMKNWGHFIPFVSKRWNFFKEFGLIEIAVEALRWYISSKNTLGIPNSKDYIKYSEEDFEDFLQHMIWAIERAHSKELSRKWLDALRNDKEIIKMLERYYEKSLMLTELKKEALNLNLKVIGLMKNPKSDKNQVERIMVMLSEINARLDTVAGRDASLLSKYERARPFYTVPKQKALTNPSRQIR